MTVHTFLIAAVLFFGLPAGQLEYRSGFQESPSLELKINRDLGFGLGGQIQGRFSLRASGPDDLERVEFYLDDKLIGEDSSHPFSVSFDTGDYKQGTHRLRAAGHLAGGGELQSNVISRQFVSVQGVLLVVGGIIILVVGFRLASSFLMRDKKSVSAVGYSYLGGTVCPNCGKAFGIHWWSLRLGIGRLDRCPHCRKWNMVSRTSPEALETAERLVRSAYAPGAAASDPDITEDDILRQKIEESRFDDS